jgi:ribosome-associated heat shock protein Hsp15
MTDKNIARHSGAMATRTRCHRTRNPDLRTKTAWTGFLNSTGCYLERQRLDKWLWHARVVRARASAAALIEAGHVRVNGAREKAPGHSLKAGDVVTIGLDRTVRILKVVGFAERRGDAAAARVLYDDLQARPE